MSDTERKTDIISFSSSKIELVKINELYILPLLEDMNYVNSICR